MKEPKKDHVETHKMSDNFNRFIGYVARRLGHCGCIHEGSGKRENHARIKLAVEIDSCPNCQAALSAQTQQAAS